jgi:hypothetical protein
MGDLSSFQKVDLRTTGTDWLVVTDKVDIVTIGLQECKVNENELRKWCLNKANYREFEVEAYVSVGDIRLILLVRKTLARDGNLTAVSTDTVKTGIANAVGNKGACGVSFQLFDATFAFVSAHLAAHQEKSSDRADNYWRIVSNLKLGHNKFEVVNQFDFLFFMGDLNYRIEMDSAKEVMAMAQEGKFAELYKADQLRAAMAEGTVFHDFVESEPTFPPTYKYKVGTREYTDKRIPSYTDRVLWKTFPGHSVSVLKHVDAPDVLLSDHSPVRCVVEVDAPLTPTRQPPHRFTLKFSGLAASDLKVSDLISGSSDPYLVFHTTRKAELGRTSVVKKSVNPEWPDVSFSFRRSILPEDIEERHILVKVWDHDIGTTNDAIGSAVISLAGVAAGPVSFELNVIHSGKAAGKLRGTVELSAELYSAQDNRKSMAV